MTDEGTIEDLERLDAEPGLQAIEAELNRLNIFRVLKSDRGELKHSNVLAWLLDPIENHGLKHRFLEAFLAQLCRYTPANDHFRQHPLPPLTKSLADTKVTVARELDSLDVLTILEWPDGEKWVLCIENKIGSSQGVGQLSRYFDLVEEHHGDAAHRLYAFLTLKHEPPTHSAFLDCTYRDIIPALDKILGDPPHTPSPDVALILRHYKDLIGTMMEDSDLSKTALEIYKRHKKAIDLIIDVRPDPRWVFSQELARLISEDASKLDILPAKTEKKYIRFTPAPWAVPHNTGGAWGADQPFILCELAVHDHRINLKIQVGDLPEDFKVRLWSHAENAPFKRSTSKLPKRWASVYTRRKELKPELTEADDPVAIAAEVYAWLRTQLDDEKFRTAVTEIEKLLKE